MIDFTLVEHPDGEVIVHAPDCPVVVQARLAGWPLATLFDCQKTPTFMPMGECLRRLAAGDGEPAL